MDRYLQVNNDGIVVNIIIWDGISPYSVPGLTMYACKDFPEATVGWVFDGQTFNYVDSEESPPS